MPQLDKLAERSLWLYQEQLRLQAIDARLKSSDMPTTDLLELLLTCDGRGRDVKAVALGELIDRAVKEASECGIATQGAFAQFRKPKDTLNA